MPILVQYLREMLRLIHLFQLYASPIDKTILANGIFWVKKIALLIPLCYATKGLTGNFGNYTLSCKPLHLKAGLYIILPKYTTPLPTEYKFMIHYL